MNFAKTMAIILGMIENAHKAAPVVKMMIDAAKSAIENQKRQEDLPYTWTAVDSSLAATFADEHPDKLPAEVLLEGMAHLGEQGRRMIQHLAPQLKKLEAANPDKVIFVKLT
ncbi:hypothetical protein [Zavarzinella formosa]|uniref:hypothetical protein n=1 Tax=Zavarzinella formosa TaxID=360055 RepID=UPI0003067E31|nr:hypothetical protein [Zavarzinella formosa]